jgi:Tol biopolymer transport system component
LTVENGSPAFAPAIWLAHPNGTGLHKLTAGDEPAWSADGQWIAYIGTRGQRQALFMIHPDGTDRTQLTPFGGALSGPDETIQPSC